MAYNPVTFTVGQVLTATQMGLVQGNIDTVRISHRGPSPPTSPPGGAMWWDDSQAIWNLNLNTGSGSWIPALFLDTQSREAGLAAQGKTWGSVPMVDRAQARTVFAGMPYFPKNMLLNANFQYWQRGNTFNVIACRSYFADRWFMDLAGAGRITIAQNTLVPTGVSGDYSQSIFVGSARSTLASGDCLNLSQPVEGSMLARAAFGRPDARPTRVSFWCLANVTGRLSFVIHGGSGSINYVAPFDINNQNAWEYKELQIPAVSSGSWQQRDNRCQAYFGITLSAHSLFLTSTPAAWTFHGGNVDLRSCSGQLNLMNGVGTQFYWTAVQWEIGEISTPIEMLPESIEMHMLKRYYAKSFSPEIRPSTTSTNSPSNLWGTLRCAADTKGFPSGMYTFNVPMRVPPAIAFFNPMQTNTYGTWYNSTDGRTTNFASASGFIWREGFFPQMLPPLNGNNANDNLNVHWVADAEMYTWD